MIVQNTFNSNFSCKCQASCKYEIGRHEFVFKYTINDRDHERSYGNIIDNNDAILDDLVLQPNFIYYDNHEFHELSKHLHQTNDFSLFHTNICSFNTNLEKLKHSLVIWNLVSVLELYLKHGLLKEKMKLNQGN